MMQESLTSDIFIALTSICKVCLFAGSVGLVNDDFYMSLTLVIASGLLWWLLSEMKKF